MNNLDEASFIEQTDPWSEAEALRAAGCRLAEEARALGAEGATGLVVECGWLAAHLATAAARWSVPPSLPAR